MAVPLDMSRISGSIRRQADRDGSAWKCRLTPRAPRRLEHLAVLAALRKENLVPTRHEAATAAVRARIGPLMGEDGAQRGPPCHGARCLLLASTKQALLPRAALVRISHA